MKKTAFVLAASVLAAFIVLPVVHSVNHFAGKIPVIGQTLRADGDPMPPPVPKPMPPGAAMEPTLLADGDPMPPPVPKPMPPGAAMEPTLLADGDPMPPPVPKPMPPGIVS